MVFRSRSRRLVARSMNPFFANLLIRIWNRNSAIQVVIHNRIQLGAIIVISGSLCLLCILIALKHLTAYHLIGMITQRSPGHFTTSISLLHILIFIKHQRFVVCCPSFELLMRHEQMVLVHLLSS